MEELNRADEEDASSWTPVEAELCVPPLPLRLISLYIWLGRRRPAYRLLVDGFSPWRSEELCDLVMLIRLSAIGLSQEFSLL